MDANDPKLKEVRRVADAKAAAILLDDYRLAVEETPENWLFKYIPKERVRGGGFQLTISKATRQVIDVERYQ